MLVEEAPEEQPADEASSVVFALRGLTRTFGRTVAVDRIDLEVRAAPSAASSGPTAPARRPPSR
ncbi:hypothetical protein Q0F99_14820 [Rathayibacter oskolensis]|uniref:hypothetical protein n=1 Tax=Rathayibacter oskolensis TaxID=1891671 RepID=UPI00265F5515|nr:hypothetical protein [Rathayibacter oskolensis]WKK70970.1 hypothetical protein Q0F99_14820 [Rathayibacter oskolensis]